MTISLKKVKKLLNTKKEDRVKGWKKAIKEKLENLDKKIDEKLDKDVSQGLKHKFVRNKLAQAWEVLDVLEDFEYFSSLREHFDERIEELMENPGLFKEKIKGKEGEKSEEGKEGVSLEDIDEDSSPEEVIRLLKKLVYQDLPHLKLKAKLKTIRERTGGKRKGWGLGDLEEQIDEIKKEKAQEEVTRTIIKEDREVKEEEREKAEEKLEEEPLKFIVKTIGKRHKGDKQLKALSYLTALSSRLSDVQLHFWPIGKSGVGKSHLLRNAILTLPQGYYEIFTSLSPKALYYYVDKYGRDSLDGMLVFFDEVEASKDSIPVLRSLTSQTKIKPRHLSVDTDTSDKLLDLGIEGDQTIWFTSVRPLEDDQLKNRFVIGNPDESKEQDQEVFKYQDEKFRKAKENKELHSDFYVCRAMTKEIVENTKEKNILIPFGIEWTFKDDRRMYPFFCSLLKLITKVNFKKREVINGYLIAEKEDLEIAINLWDTIKAFTKEKITKEAKDLLPYIPKNKINSKTRSELAEETNLSTRQVIYRADRELLEADLVSKYKESGKWHYWRRKGISGKSEVGGKWDNFNEKDLKEFLEERIGEEIEEEKIKDLKDKIEEGGEEDYVDYFEMEEGGEEEPPEGGENGGGEEEELEVPEEEVVRERPTKWQKKKNLQETIEKLGDKD